jgi:hypothetical protein
MLKKYGILSCILSIGFTLVLYGQDVPKIAVLNATLGENVDINASAIVADRINEQFVTSPEYRVTDRVYISNIQEEKKFQLSGDVSESDIKALGETFGADYICVPHVSILGSTYTISARLIEVETAEVIDQKSERMQGSIDILYDLAEMVGTALVGGESKGSLVKSEEKQEVEKETTYTPPTYTPPQEKSWKPYEARSHLVLSLVVPTYDGLEESIDDYSIWTMDEWYNYYYPEYDAYTDAIGIDLHYLEPFAKYLYLSVGMTFTSQTLYLEALDSEYGTFRTLESYVGFGGIIAPVSFIDFYGGITLGYFALFLGTGYDGDASSNLWGDYDGDSAGGVSIGMEIGSDIWLGIFGLNLRYRYSGVGSLSGDAIDDFGDDFENADFAQGGLYVGGGLYF